MVSNPKVGLLVQIGDNPSAPLGMVVSSAFKDRYNNEGGVSVRVFIPGTGIVVLPCVVLHIPYND